MRMAAQVGLGYLLFLLLGAVWRRFPLGGFQPDIVALMAAYLGLTAREELAPSVAAAVCIGYLADLLFGTPTGLMATVGGTLCIASHFLHSRLLVRGPVFTIVFSTVVALCSSLFILAIRAGNGLMPLGFGSSLAGLWAAILCTGLLGPFVFRACRFVDSRFAKTRRERDAAATGAML